MKLKRVASLSALLAPAPAALAQGFGSIFFVTMESTADGTGRIDWLGSSMIWALILLSVVNAYLISTLWFRNQRRRILPEQFADEMERMLEAGQHQQAVELAGAEVSDYSAVLSAALRQAHLGHAAMTRAAEQAGEEVAVRRFRKLEVLHVMGQVSPMIGLLGTVYGVIVAFQAIAHTGGNADPVTLASGIGTALVTTFWGLLIAIPALSAYATIRNKVDASTLESVRRVEKAIGRFAPAESRANPAAAHRAAPPLAKVGS
ncbi:MAG: MotA/TolQ/ExbB proton channel family protein [Planctomycetes bacterium]|nr:MotA/TolQ/ExbB proton channel family protein [Planctomycetota bacterium]